MELMDVSTFQSVKAWAASLFVRCVQHGTNAATARPAGAGSVIWLGDVQPTNMTSADIWVGSGTVVTAPGAPTNLAATPASGQVALTWTAPASNGGAAITDYVVQYSTDGSTWNTFADGTSTTAAATVTGLTNGTAYSFRVAAVNSAGTGSASSVATATPTAGTLPGAPTGLTATPGSSQVGLTWTAPASVGSGTLTDYVVQYSTDGSTWNTFADGTSTTAAATVTGLTNGTAYSFRVAAVTTIGTGSYSSAVTSTPTGGVTTLAADTFNRADTHGSTNVLGTSSGGQTWIADTGATSIQSNAARATTLAGGTARATIDVAASDCTVTATLAGSAFNVYLVARAATAANFLRLLLSGGTLYLQSQGATAGTIGTAAYTPVTGDVVSLVMSGTSLIVKVNGTTKITATSATYQTGTKHGIGFEAATANDTFDSFTVTTP